MNKKNKKPEITAPERRSSLCEVRAERDAQNGAYITGHPIVFGQEIELETWTGSFREVIDRDAIDSATDMKDVRFLVGHDTSRIPMARSRNNNGNSTMKLEKDETGLAMRANVDIENNATAKELYSAAERGDISGMSFMFRVDKESWEDLDSKKPLRRIMHISRIYEVSAVAFPAYEGTDLEAADESQRLESVMASLESARKRLQQEREEQQNRERREKALQTLRR